MRWGSHDSWSRCHLDPRLPLDPVSKAQLLMFCASSRRSTQGTKQQLDVAFGALENAAYTGVVDKVLNVYASPEEAEKATRRAYWTMTGNERVALCIELQRRYYEQNHDAPRRLPRVLTVLERP